jgi:serine protease inhibitor
MPAPALAILAALATTASPPTPPTPPAADIARNTPAIAGANTFGMDLFRRVGQANPGKNVFLSPYSISTALSMVAEGARGQTEREMNTVLRVPEANAGRSITRVHESYAALAAHYAAESGKAPPEVREKIKALKKALDDANEKAESFERKQKYTDAMEWNGRAKKAAEELNALYATVDRYDLRTANSLWVDQAFNLAPEYIKSIDTYYGAGGVVPVDFTRQAEKARLRINGWVEDHTENRIKDLLPQGSLGRDTRLVIVNAVYFKGQWTQPFPEGATREEDFHLLDGGTGKARLMQDSWRSAVSYAAFNADGSFFDTPHKIPKEEADRPPCYPGDDGFTMIQLPYKGGDLAMTILLPRTPDAKSLDALEFKFTGDALAGWSAKLDARNVNTAVPKFKMEFEQELSKSLKAMGMTLPFTDAADFSGMTGPSAQGLAIDLVQHKAWVEMTEKGTEAAAATAVSMRVTSAPVRQEMVSFTPVFRADHPFLFVIRDTKSGMILFAGRVVNPS